MKKTIIIILLLILAVLSLVFSLAEYEDVSNQDRYVGLINKKFQSFDELLVHGVTLLKNNEKVLDHYTVTHRPGFGGREVLSRCVLPVGAIIQIKRIDNYSNFLFESNRLEIEILTNRKYKNDIVFLRNNGDKIILKNKDGRAFMNPELFKEITVKHSHSHIPSPCSEKTL